MISTVTRRAFFSTTIAAGMALAGLSVPAAAQEELIFNIFIPKNAPLVKEGLLPWAEAVEAASNGELKLTIPTSSLAPPPRVWDIVQDGVADIAIAQVVFRENQINLPLIAAIPLVASSAEAASAALWDMHQETFDAAGQWKDFVPLALFTLGTPSIVSNAGPIISPEDLVGYKMVVTGEDNIEIWKDLGASPVAGGSTPPFEFLSGGVADGIISALGTAVTVGLLDASDSITLVPGGAAGRTVFALFISRDRFEGLSDEARAALLETSGRALSAEFGAIMDAIDGSGLQAFRDKGIEVFEASPELVQAISGAVGRVEETWLAQAAEAGIDGAAALKAYRASAGE